MSKFPINPSIPSGSLFIHTLVVNVTYDSLFLSSPILKWMTVTQIMLTWALGLTVYLIKQKEPLTGKNFLHL